MQKSILGIRKYILWYKLLDFNLRLETFLLFEFGSKNIPRTYFYQLILAGLNPADAIVHYHRRVEVLKLHRFGF